MKCPRKGEISPSKEALLVRHGHNASIRTDDRMTPYLKWLTYDPAAWFVLLEDADQR
jgi:hypothetical protein